MILIVTVNERGVAIAESHLGYETGSLFLQQMLFMLKSKLCEVRFIMLGN